MEYRAQTYLGALQLLAVLFGSLFLAAAVDKVGDMLKPDPDFDPLRSVRPVARFGWLLVALPIAWIWLTIRAEIQDSRWATKGVVIASGTLLLAGITILFFWGGRVALDVLAPLGGWW